MFLHCLLCNRLMGEAFLWPTWQGSSWDKQHKSGSHMHRQFRETSHWCPAWINHSLETKQQWVFTQGQVNTHTHTNSSLMSCVFVITDISHLYLINSYTITSDRNSAMEQAQQKVSTLKKEYPHSLNVSACLSTLLLGVGPLRSWLPENFILLCIHISSSIWDEVLYDVSDVFLLSISKSTPRAYSIASLPCALGAPWVKLLMAQ